MIVPLMLADKSWPEGGDWAKTGKLQTRANKTSQIEVAGPGIKLPLDPRKNSLREEFSAAVTIPSLSPSLFVPARFDGAWFLEVAQYGNP
jgi:hypothetical protein